MKFRSYSAGLIIIIVLIIPCLICFGQELQGSGELEMMIRSIQGLTSAELSELKSAFQEELSQELLEKIGYIIRPLNQQSEIKG